MREIRACAGIVISPEAQPTFSEIVGQFLEQCCKRGEDVSVTDGKLFKAFRNYWMSMDHQEQHPAMLGQLRVEMTERGYRSQGSKRVKWYGLTLKEEAAKEKKVRRVRSQPKEKIVKKMLKAKS